MKRSEMESNYLSSKNRMKPVKNTIQLLYNPNMEFPKYNDPDLIKKKYINNSRK